MSNHFVDYFGNVPCCINAHVVEPDHFVNNTANPDAKPRDVRLGDVLGVCSITGQNASITWLGKVWLQNFTDARLLTIQFNKIPGKLKASASSIAIGSVASQHPQAQAHQCKTGFSKP